MFLLEFVEAGDLATLIHSMKSFSEAQTQFYAAIIVLCLEFLHDNNIMYRYTTFQGNICPNIYDCLRDLKMENLLIDSQGYLKLVDFGLSKTNMTILSRTTTFCGTVDYMAPEVLIDDSYTRMVDWWALGVLIYYMVVGQVKILQFLIYSFIKVILTLYIFFLHNFLRIPYKTNIQVPFGAETDMESLNAIIARPILPSTTKASLSSFILALMDRNPYSRLGSQNGAADIKSHSYFKAVSFSKLFSKAIAPPFIPHLVNTIYLPFTVLITDVP